MKHRQASVFSGTNSALHHGSIPNVMLTNVLISTVTVVLDDRL